MSLKKILTLLIFFTGIQIGFSQYNNASLNGPWYVLTTDDSSSAVHPVYIIFDGNGEVTELGEHNSVQPNGSYNVQSDGSFTGTITVDSNMAPIYGKLYTDSTGNVNAVFGPDTAGPFGFIRINNVAKLEGEWTGYFGENQIRFATELSIDAEGNVTVTSTDLATPVSGKLFDENDFLSGLVSTGETNEWNEFSIRGTFGSDTLMGILRFDCNQCANGDFLFTKVEPSAIPGVAKNLGGLRCFPNPFTDETVIEFNLLNAVELEVLLFDQGGKMVRTLFEGEQGAGEHRLAWDGTDDSGRAMPSGKYSYMLMVEGKPAAKGAIVRVQ